MTGSVIFSRNSGHAADKRPRMIRVGAPAMTAPNLFIVYVTDIERATNFYRDLFEIEPVMITPRYVPFEVAPGDVIRAVEQRRRAGRSEDPAILHGRPDGAPHGGRRR
jgi:hypothetical protein